MSEMTDGRRRDVLDALILLHTEVDRRAGALARRHRRRLRCGSGCRECCVDGIRVFAIEAERIRRFCGELLAHGEPHPPGACAFLDAAGACRIHAHRPYVCRTQGLPLRWTEPGPAGGGVERRDICPLNEDGPPVETLPAGECWTIGPFEGRLAALQKLWGAGRLERVALRSLFSRDDRGQPGYRGG